MGGKGKNKRKKDPNSPESESEKQEQKRVTMAASQQQQPQAGGLYFPYGPSVAIGQPYYGASPPPPPNLSQITSMASAIPLPKSPDPGPAGPMPISHDILSKILERLDGMDSKLGQLSSIQSSLSKVTVDVSNMNTKVMGMEKQLNDLETSRTFDSSMLDSIQKKQNYIDTMLKKMEKIEEDQREKLLDLQSREMRDNLIFYGIEEEKDESDKDCVGKVLKLVENELKIPNAQQIPIHRAHRMGRYQRTKTRPIVAKFAFYPNREEIRKAARNLEGTQYSISQQFPKEIQDRRRQLVPILKDAKAKGQKAHIAVDKLYIDGRFYRNDLRADDNTYTSTVKPKGAEKSAGAHCSQRSQNAPGPEGARGFNVLSNEAEA